MHSGDERERDLALCVEVDGHGYSCVLEEQALDCDAALRRELASEVCDERG